MQKKTIQTQIKKVMEVNSLEIPLSVDMEVCVPSWATKIDLSQNLLYKAKDGIIDYIDWD